MHHSSESRSKNEKAGRKIPQRLPTSSREEQQCDLILEEATKNGWMLSQHWSCPFWDTKDAWQNRLLLKIWPCSIFIIYHHYGFIICTISFDKRRRSQFLFSTFVILKSIQTRPPWPKIQFRRKLAKTLIWTFAIKTVKKNRSKIYS